MELEPYLFFDGTCEEALTFYASVFGGGITALMRFEGSPLAEEMPPDARNRVMHANFVAPSLRFMGADSNRASECTGSHVALSLSSRNVPECQRIFEALAAGGAVTMPFGKTFWGAMFGMLTDRYGIDWMVNCELES